MLPALLSLLALQAHAGNTLIGDAIPGAPGACEPLLCVGSAVQPARPVGASTAADLYRRVPAGSLPREAPPQHSATRDWNSNMAPRAQQEDFSCLLSFGVGGTFGSTGSAGARGYKAVRVGGITHTLTPAKGKARP